MVDGLSKQELEGGHLEKSFGLQVSSLRFKKPEPETHNPNFFLSSIFPSGF
jgi:hypothetical protein